MFLVPLCIFIPLSELSSSHQMGFSGSVLSLSRLHFLQAFSERPHILFQCHLPRPSLGPSPQVPSQGPLQTVFIISFEPRFSRDRSLQTVGTGFFRRSSGPVLGQLFQTRLLQNLLRLLCFVSFTRQFFKCCACCSFFSLHPDVLGCSGRASHRRPCALKQRRGLNTDRPCGLRTLKQPSSSWGLLSPAPSWDRGVRMTKCPSRGGFESSHQSPLCPWDTGRIWTPVREEPPNWPRAWTRSSEVSSAPFSTRGPSSRSTQRSIFGDIGLVTARSGQSCGFY